MTYLLPLIDNYRSEAKLLVIQDLNRQDVVCKVFEEASGVGGELGVEEAFKDEGIVLISLASGLSTVMTVDWCILEVWSSFFFFLIKLKSIRLPLNAVNRLNVFIVLLLGTVRKMHSLSVFTQRCMI